jgi:hypothetical protein
MAVDHGKDGIRVNCIPSLAQSIHLWFIQMGMSKSQRSQRQNASLIELEGTGWDIGKAGCLPLF